MRITFRWFFSSCLIRTADRHLYGHNLRCLWLFFALFQYSASTHCALISYGSDSPEELNIMPTATHINKFTLHTKRMYCSISSNDYILKSKHHLAFSVRTCARVFSSIGSIMICHKRKHNLAFFYLRSLNHVGPYATLMNFTY